MNIKFIITILLFMSIYLNANNTKIINIDNSTSNINLLSNAFIYIDRTKKLDFKEIIDKQIIFKENKKNILSYGYSPNFNVWIKLILHNSTNNTIRKIIEYDNTLTTEVIFFDNNHNIKFTDGLLHTPKDRKTTKPIFDIILEPNETNTYYIKTSSNITTLILKLNLWEQKDFYHKETFHQLILALFFGAMSILALYNLFIFFFTKDISYFYYVLYIIGIIFHQLVYVGMVNIYLLSQDEIYYIIQYAAILVSFPIISLALFTKIFLHTKQYSRINKILNIFLILIPISIIIFSITDKFNQYRNIVALTLFSYLLVITVYSAYKKNKQAYLILFGWTIILSASILMLLSGIGIFDFSNDCPYIVEFSFITEALIFSVALANKINILQNEKDKVNQKLIKHQSYEKEKLKINVEEKTQELHLLLKELNHRVKNNMQTIVSLIRLQSDGLSDKKYKDIFLVIQNRINAMSHLHELLYNQNNISTINANEYFRILIDEVKYSYEIFVDVNINIKTNLKIEHAIYCGLILNELITNAFKYAFIKNNNRINIIDNVQVGLTQENNLYTLIVSDNGVGYEQNKITTSLGYTLINSLVKDQLKGSIDIKSNNGVTVIIKWRDNE